MYVCTSKPQINKQPSDKQHLFEHVTLIEIICGLHDRFFIYAKKGEYVSLFLTMYIYLIFKGLTNASSFDSKVSLISLEQTTVSSICLIDKNSNQDRFRSEKCHVIVE